jgi:hypothetical protein
MTLERTRLGAEHTGWPTYRPDPSPSERSSERASCQLVVSGIWRTTICVVAQLPLYWARVQYS